MGWVEPEAPTSTSSEGASEAMGSASEAMAAGLAHLLATELPAVAAEIDMEGLATAQVGRRASWVDLQVDYAANPKPNPKPNPNALTLTLTPNPNPNPNPNA
eukprot:scaffold107371_cov53-Phaeocystis_antarctica.AAC.1